MSTTSDKVLAAVMKAGAPTLDLEKLGAKAFETLVDSFGQAASPATAGVRKAFGPSLVPLAKDGTGGAFAEWHGPRGTRPVVYFSTEGYVGIAARDVRIFLGQLARSAEDGWTLHDALLYWYQTLTTVVGDPPSPKSALIASPQAEVEPRIAAVLETNGIPIAADLRASVEEASRAFLWAFVDALDIHVTGHRALSTWFEAWNVAPADSRSFSPTERYVVGERVRYTSKLPGGGVYEGRAVVLGHPAPNRVLLADQHNTFVRACA